MRVRCWQPRPDEPARLDWWRPLRAASVRARTEATPWPIRTEDFTLLGRMDRPAGPAIWLYRHQATGGILPLDADGQAYRYLPSPGRPGGGRFQAATIRQAALAAGLPPAGADVEVAQAGAHEPCPPAGVVRRAHLRLVVNR